MKKKHRLLFLLVVTFFFNIQIANSATNNFGGIVTLAPSASQIILAESEGYFCPLVGKTFNIKPVKGPTGPYLVQAISLNGMLAGQKKEAMQNPHTPVLTVTTQPTAMKMVDHIISVHGSISAWDPVSVGATTAVTGVDTAGAATNVVAEGA